MIGSLISLCILLVIVGFVAWLVLKLVPIAEPFKSVILALLAIICLLMVLGTLFGWWAPPKLAF